MFVELVEGLLACTFEADSILTIFRARQSDAMIVTFKAHTYSASKNLSKDLSDPHLHIKVGRCDPESRSYSYLSDSSASESAESEYESEPEFESFPYQVIYFTLVNAKLHRSCLFQLEHVFLFVNRQRNWGPRLSCCRSQAETEETPVIFNVYMPVLVRC